MSLIKCQGCKGTGCVACNDGGVALVQFCATCAEWHDMDADCEPRDEHMTPAYRSGMGRAIELGVD